MKLNVQKTFLAFGNSLSWKTSKIRLDEPNENRSQTLSGESKVSRDSTQITNVADNSLTIGTKVSFYYFIILSYIQL